MRKEAKPLPTECQNLRTKSERIRYLHSIGWKRGDIGRAVGVSYQFVDNVIKRPLKRVIKAEREARKQREREARQASCEKTR